MTEFSESDEFCSEGEKILLLSKLLLADSSFADKSSIEISDVEVAIVDDFEGVAGNKVAWISCAFDRSEEFELTESDPSPMLLLDFAEST